MRGLCYAGRMSAPERPVPSFEECLKRLETIVAQLERSDLPLEESIQLFEEGMRISESCRKQLDEAEGKIEMLVKKGGKTTTEPFELAENGRREGE